MGCCSIFLLLICITQFLAINAQEQLIRREALEIIIGGGGGAPPPETQDCPPPPPPPCPPPPIPPPPPPCPPPPIPPQIKSPPQPKKSPPPPPPPKKSPPPPKKSPPPPPPPKRPPPPPPPRRKNPPPSPKPPKKPSSPPSEFESPQLEIAYNVITRFRKKIVNDPTGITKKWKGKNVCNYGGSFTCDKAPGEKLRTLAGVNFNNRNFSGPDLTVGEILVGLKDIVFFHANSNNFKGTIPAEASKLKYFFELDLSNNKLSGPFPNQVLGAKKLLFLDLRFNNFEGSVPPQIFTLDLDLLFINNNNFVPQKIPDTLGNTPALYLVLANNKFIGGIPKSIGLAKDTLLEVLFLNNQLTGCLPYEIGYLKKAQVFDVGFNQLMGPIPHSFQCLKNMELLNLAYNRFSGIVPEAVCSLPNLQNFTLSYNYFTQVGEKCRKLIKDGKLHVKMNCILDLADQRSPAECAKFFSVPHKCPDEKSLTYVPCSQGKYGNELESSDMQWTTLTPELAPAQAPLGRSYGALAPH